MASFDENLLLLFLSFAVLLRKRRILWGQVFPFIYTSFVSYFVGPIMEFHDHFEIYDVLSGYEPIWLKCVYSFTFL